MTKQDAQDGHAKYTIVQMKMHLSQCANSLVIRVLNCSGLNPTWVLKHWGKSELCDNKLQQFKIEPSYSLLCKLYQ